MTVTATNRKNQFSTNGVTTEFTFDFAITDVSQVYALTVDDDGTETVFENFTAVKSEVIEGGTLTTNEVLSGVDLLIYRDTALTQQVDYESGGKFPADSHEQALDKLTLQNQDQQEELDRTLKSSISNDDPYTVGKLESGFMLASVGSEIVSTSITEGDLEIAKGNEITMIARSLNVLNTQVIYSTDTTTVLDDVLYIYDASEQITYAKPSNVGIGEVIVSVDSGVLTTDEDSYALKSTNKSGVIFETIANIDSGNSIGGEVNLMVGDTVIANDYATGNNSGVLFFKVVAGGTGTEDGGKYIDLSSGLQLEQNLARPYNITAWGGLGNGSTLNDNVIENWINYSGKLYAPAGDYHHANPIIWPTGTWIDGDGCALDGTGASTRFTKTTNNDLGLADASFIFGDNVSVQYIKASNFEVDSVAPNNTEYAFWSEMRGSTLSIANSTLEDIVIRNHDNGTHFEKCWLMTYRKVRMGGGIKGFYVGYNNSTSNNFYDCYTNQTETGYHINSVYSSINGSAADGANVAYRIGNGVSINDSACEFPSVAVLAEYTAKPLIINKLLVICKDEGTTLCYNYDGTKAANVIFTNSEFSATETAKENLTVANVKGLESKPRHVQFINSYVGTYNTTTDNTDLYPLWDFPIIKSATDKFITIYYGESKKQKIIDDALAIASVPLRKFLLTRVSNDGEYTITYNKPFGDTQSTYLPNGRLGQVSFICNGGYVALISSALFNASQEVKFYTKTDDDSGIYVRYQQQNDVGNAVLQTISGGIAENRYPLEQLENEAGFTEVTPYSQV